MFSGKRTPKTEETKRLSYKEVQEEAVLSDLSWVFILSSSSLFSEV